MNIKNFDTKSTQVLKIDKSWTLFLDRDGVINKRVINDYVLKWEQFEFMPNALKAIKKLSKLFGNMFIITNQQGIGKGLMTKDDLLDIHKKAIDKIEQYGGKIDKIYFCPFKKQDNSFLRKPNIGMALQAKKDYPEINFKKSVMIGDSITDMEFGSKMKMINVFISGDLQIIRENHSIINYTFEDLFEFSQNF